MAMLGRYNTLFKKSSYPMSLLLLVMAVRGEGNPL